MHSSWLLFSSCVVYLSKSSHTTVSRRRSSSCAAVFSSFRRAVSDGAPRGCSRAASLFLHPSCISRFAPSLAHQPFAPHSQFMHGAVSTATDNTIAVSAVSISPTVDLGIAAMKERQILCRIRFRNSVRKYPPPSGVRGRCWRVRCCCLCLTGNGWEFGRGVERQRTRGCRLSL